MDERTDDLGTYAEYRETSIIQPVSDLTPLDDREAANELTAADEEPQRPEDVIEEIEQTRAEMTGTIDAIQERLSPQRLKQQAQDAIHDATIGRVEQVVSNVQDSARGAGNTILGTIRANPLPAALVGAGLGWLFIKGRQNAQAQSATMTHWPLGAPYAGGYPGGYPGYGAPYAGYPNQWGGQQGDPQRNGLSQAAGTVQDKAGQLSDSVQAKAGQLADSVQSTAGQLSDSVQSTAQQVGWQAQHQAQQVQSRFQQALRENPLALGAIALALGAAVGLAVPETQQEQHLMGPARDSLLDHAQDAAQDTVQKVQTVVQKAKTAAQEEATNQGLVDNTHDDDVSASHPSR